MKYYDNFQYPNSSDTGFEGDPTTVAEALGEALISFEQLDEQFSTSIAFLLRRGDTIGQIVTAELSLRMKINLFVLLFKHEASETKHSEQLCELAGACGNAEQIRNQLIHSNWRHKLEGAGMVRTKFTARAKHGLRQQLEGLTPNQVHAFSLHCMYLAHCVDELMYMEFGHDYGEP